MPGDAYGRSFLYGMLRLVLSQRRVCFLSTQAMKTDADRLNLIEAKYLMMENLKILYNKETYVYPN